LSTISSPEAFSPASVAIVFRWSHSAVRASKGALLIVLSSIALVPELSCTLGAATLTEVAQEHRDRGELDLSINAYREAIEKDPSRAELFTELAEVYYDRGDILEASYAAEKALALDPGQRRADAVLAIAELALGYPSEALPHALRASDTPRPDGNALWVLASTFNQLGKYVEAERVYAMALASAFYPGSPAGLSIPPAMLSTADSGYVNLGTGFALQAQGRMSEALAWYDSALVRIPSEPEVYYRKGTVYERRGEYMHALFHYRQAIRLDPTFVEAQIRMGVTLVDAGDLLAARDLLLSVYYDYEPVAEVIYVLGRIAEHKGFLLEAVGYYREARTVDSAMGRAWLREGMILIKLKRDKEGRECLYRAVEEGSTAAKWILGIDPKIE
jgi:tetratricopeptide (TPR) repeat protein